MNVRKLLMCALAIIICSCSDHKMYYDVKNQELISCDKKRFRMLEISSENEGTTLFWYDTVNMAPNVLILNNIPDGYEIKTDGLRRKNPFLLIPNESYLIIKSGGGVPEDSVRIWTDSKGKVYKTTKSKCN